jgi:HD-GYP domain-containing protein (c-di-GMP phosphodiesterase class II)
MKLNKHTKGILTGYLIISLICCLLLIITISSAKINLIKIILIFGLVISLILFIRKVIQLYIESRNVRFKKVVDLIGNINEDTSFEGTLEYMFYSFRDYIPYSHIGIALLKDDGVIEASYGLSNPNIEITSKIIGIQTNLYHTSLAKIVETGEPRVINDLPNYIKNPNTPYNQIILAAGINSSITYPLKIYNKAVGIIFFSSVYKNIYNAEHIEFLKTLSNSIAISLNKNLFIEELLLSQVLSLAKLAEARDEDTGEHLIRMQAYTLKIAELLYKDKIFPELTLKLIKDIARFSPLHDIGKVGIRDGILLKPGKLTATEFKEMQEHTSYGAKVLEVAEAQMVKFNKSLFKVGIEVAIGHHEKWDGSGYPYQQKGDEIPLSARIVAVADVFDALTSKRPYKEAFSYDEAKQIIIKGKGNHFDPRIIACIEKNESELFSIYKQYQKNDSI